MHIIVYIMGTYYSYQCVIKTELRRYLVSHIEKISCLLYREPITSKHKGNNHYKFRELYIKKREKIKRIVLVNYPRFASKYGRYKIRDSRKKNIKTNHQDASSVNVSTTLHSNTERVKNKKFLNLKKVGINVY